MEMIGEICILGTNYGVYESDDVESSELVDAEGVTDYTSKIIKLLKYVPGHGDVSDVRAHKQQVLRHELVHAFFFESGLSDYSHDETLVDWIAYMLPALEKACQGINDVATHITSSTQRPTA